VAFAALGAAVKAVPLPWLPHTLAQRLRGALVQDIATRHRVALTPSARSVLSNPTTTKRKHGPMAEAIAYLSRKLFARFGPLAVLLPLRAALETFVLGHLFDRYLAHTARKPGARFEVKEARLVRHAIERAVVRIANTDAGLQWVPAPRPPEEYRDDVTRLLDGVLSATTTIPAWVLHRLDTAFDDALTEP
jgi:hypothetical protein